MQRPWQSAVWNLRGRSSICRRCCTLSGSRPRCGTCAGSHVVELVAEVLHLAAEHGSALTVANATMLRGWARVASGRLEDGVTEVLDGVAKWRATGSRFHASYRFARALSCTGYAETCC